MSSQTSEISPIPFQVNGPYLVVPIPPNPNAAEIEQMCRALLDRLHASPKHGVVFDCSQTVLLDSGIARALDNVARPAALLGARIAIAGLTAGLCSGLARLDVSLDALLKAHDLGHAFELIEKSQGSRP